MQNAILKELEQIKVFAMLGAKNVLTLDEAALVMNVTPKYLYKLISERAITHYKPNRFVYFLKSDVEAWLTKNRVLSNDAIHEEASRQMQELDARRMAN